MLALGLALLTILPPASAAGQFSDPCRAACATVLSATSFAAATGAVVAVGRLSGGVSRVEPALAVWGASFLALTGSGIALSGNGERQRRAVYGAGIGAVAGSLLWLGVESSFDGGDGSRRVAASLMGAAAGALLGGIYGAVSYRTRGIASPMTVLTVRLRF